MGIALALPEAALAGNECVPNINIPNCPAGSANEGTIANAVTNAQPNDTIYIGPGTFNGPADDTGKALQFVGDGQGQTTIQGQGSPAMNVSAGSSVSNLTINLYNGQGITGLNLAGTATDVAVTGAGLTMKNPLGVQLTGAASFSHGSITLPMTVTEDEHFAGAIGSGTVSDSSITAPVGVAPDSSTFTTPALARDTVTANQGVLLGVGTTTIDDSLIRTASGAAPEQAIGVDPSVGSASFTARHDTIIGSSGAGSTGVVLNAFTAAAPATSSGTLESSIIRGYATSVSAVANASIGPFPASATVTIDRSFYDPATEKTQQTGPGPATATITDPNASAANKDPLFVNAAGGDFHLQAGSPAIDAGEASVASGESATDLDGNPRATVGHNGNPATTDIGAHEFQPHPPTGVGARVEHGTIVAGTPDSFAASGGDASPGDTVSFTWTFDDGGSASGATVTHIFTTAGSHSATVTATDLDGFTATATVSLTVIPPPPRITNLRIKPTSVRSGKRLTITYRDTQAGTTRFTVQRFRKHHKFKDVGAFRHASVQGANKVTYRPHRFPGRYRIVAVPSDAAGAGPAVSDRFTIVKKKR